MQRIQRDFLYFILFLAPYSMWCQQVQHDQSPLCSICRHWVEELSGISGNYNETEFCRLMDDACERLFSPINQTELCHGLQRNCSAILGLIEENVRSEEICELYQLCEPPADPTPAPDDAQPAMRNDPALWLLRKA
ncbi:unnamed protein product, partial [Mesorhabditis spiculigera]